MKTLPKSVYGALLLLTMPVWADNGAVISAPVVHGLKLDGDLSDWPNSVPGQPIQYTEYGTPPRGLSDLAARLRVAWDDQAHVLFVALDVTDEDMVSLSGTSLWNEQDGCELYLDIDHRPGSAARQHVLRGPWDTSLQQGPQQAGWARTDNGYACEWRMDLSGLDAVERGQGATIGFDVGINDFDHDGSFSWIAWGAGV